MTSVPIDSDSVFRYAYAGCGNDNTADILFRSKDGGKGTLRYVVECVRSFANALKTDRVLAPRATRLLIYLLERLRKKTMATGCWSGPTRVTRTFLLFMICARS